MEFIMKINIIFIIALISSMPAHGWLGNYYASFVAGFKNIFSYSYVQKNHCSNVLGEIARTGKKAMEYQKSQQQKCSGVLTEFAATAKANLDACKKQVIQESKKALVEHLRAPNISPDYFHKSAPATTRTSVFNNYEAAFLLKELDEKQKQQEAAQANEEDCENNAGRSEKPRRSTDIRELKELGQLEGSKVDKYFIKFSANLTPDNKRALRISLIQRKPGFKQMQDRKTLQITDVPCTKQLLEGTIIGVENSNNEFEWQKVTNNFDTADQEILNAEGLTIRQVHTDEKGKKPVRSIQIDENNNKVFQYTGSDFKPKKK